MGIEQTCSHILEKWSTACAEMRQHFWQHYQEKTKIIPNEVYGLYPVVHRAQKRMMNKRFHISLQSNRNMLIMKIIYTIQLSSKAVIMPALLLTENQQKVIYNSFYI